jgi:hypothetical protein
VRPLRKSRLARLALAGALALPVWGATGCGGTVIDASKTEGAIEHNLESGLHKKVKAVECPSGVDVKKGTDFECTVSLEGGGTEVATLKVLNEDADVELVRLSPGK